MAEDGAEALADRIARCRADLDILLELDAIDNIRWTSIEGVLGEDKSLPARWQAAFERFGMVSGGSAEESVQGLTKSLVSDRLLGALDLWLMFEPSERVRSILKAADPDPYREGIRDLITDAVLTGNWKDVIEQTARDEALSQPPRFTAMIGQIRAIPEKRRRKILEASLRSRVWDFSLLMSLGNTPPMERETAEYRARWYQAAIAVRPGSAIAHNNLGIALGEHDETDGAIQEFQIALALDSKFALAHNSLGWALKGKGDLKGAKQEYEAAIRFDSNFATPHNNLGLILIENEGDISGAIREYEIAIKLNPRYALPHNNLGLALTAKGDVKRAIREYEIAIKIDPRYLHAYVNLGKVLSEKGETDRAIRVYEAAIAIDPVEALPHNNLGVALAVKGDVDRAVQEYQEAIRLNIRWAPTYNNLAELLSARGESFAALQVLRVGLKVEPLFIKDFRYHLACIACLVASGKAKDEPKYVDRPGLHREALAWLTADLSELRKLATDLKNKPRVHQVILHWLDDHDLDSVRDVEKLPAEEQAGWKKLWADVRKLRDETAPPEVAPPPRLAK